MFEKKPRPFVPPAVAPRQPVVQKPAPVPMLEAPPDLEATLTPEVVAGVPPFSASVDPQLAPPPRPAPPARAPQPRAAAPPKNTPTETPTAVPPRISQLLSPQETAALSRTYEDMMARVDRGLLDLAKKSLPQSDRDTVDLIRSFQAQARAAREQDLVTAVGLAKRADVLARDLLGRLP